MKDRLLWIYTAAVFVVTLVAVIITIRAKAKPEPIMIMKPSYFKTAREIGTTLYRHFYAPFEEEKIVVFGVPPQPSWHREIVRGVLLAAAAQGRPFDILLAENEMPDLDTSDLPQLKVIKVASNTETQAELVDVLQKAKSENKRVLFYTASLFSSHLLSGNPLNRVEKILASASVAPTESSLGVGSASESSGVSRAKKKMFFSITSAPLALNSAQEFLVDPSCVGSERDTQGTAELGCEILRAGRENYRKNVKEAKKWQEKNHEDLYKTHYTAVLQQNPIGNDFLLMTAYPDQSEDATAEMNDRYRMAAPGAMGARGLPTSTEPDTRTVEDGGGIGSKRDQ